MAAQVEHDLLAEGGEPEPHERSEPPCRGVDADVAEHVEGQAALVAGLHPVVDRVADEVPADDGRRGREAGREPEHDEAHAAAARVAGEAGETGVLFTRQLRLRRAR